MELTDIRVTSVSVPKPQHAATEPILSEKDKKRTNSKENKKSNRDRGKSLTDKDKEKEKEKDEEKEKESQKAEMDTEAKTSKEAAKDAAESFLKGIELGVSPQIPPKRSKQSIDDSASKLSISAPDGRGAFMLKKAATTGLIKQTEPVKPSLIPINARKSVDQTGAGKSRKPEIEPHRIIEGSKFKLKGAAVLDTRLVYKTKTGFPFLISSIVPIDRLKRKAATQRKAHDKANGEITASLDSQPPPRSSSGNKKGQGLSYGELLDIRRDPYDPNLLDNDIAIPDKYKMTINLPGYRSTLIPFVKAPDLKKCENEIFEEKHPWLKSNITLSKIRSVKRRLMQIAIARALDIACVAFSYVYFERLVMKNIITKSNARLMGGICLLLAEKFYGTKSKSFKHLVESIEKHMGVTKKDISQNEFFVYKELAFSLYAEPAEVVPHLIKLQSTQEYLDHLFEYNAEMRKQIALAHKEAEKKRKMATKSTITR